MQKTFGIRANSFFFFPQGSTLNWSQRTAEWNNVAGVLESSVSYHWEKKNPLNRKTWSARLFLQRASGAAVVFKEGGRLLSAASAPRLVLIILTIKLKELKQSNISGGKKKKRGGFEISAGLLWIVPPPASSFQADSQRGVEWWI